MDSNRFTKFFNYGYFLSKFEPKLLKKLLSATGNSEEINESLKAGKSQYSKEQVLGKLKSFSNDSRTKKEKGLEPEI